MRNYCIHGGEGQKTIKKEQDKNKEQTLKNHNDDRRNKNIQ